MALLSPQLILTTSHCGAEERAKKKKKEKKGDERGENR